MQYKSDRVVNEAFEKELKKIEVTPEQEELLERFFKSGFKAGVDAVIVDLKAELLGVLSN